MAKNIGRLAVSSLRSQCSRRGLIRRLSTEQAHSRIRIGARTSNGVALEKPVAAGREVVHANYLSHPRRITRIHRGTQQCSNPLLARNSGRSLAGSLDFLSGRSRSYCNRAGRCGSISISLSATKFRDIQAGSRAPSPPGPKFRLSPPSVAALMNVPNF